MRARVHAWKSDQIPIALEGRIEASYWWAAWLLCALSLSSSLLWGARSDAIAAVVWLLITLVSFMQRRKTKKGSLVLHLICAFPVWTWYLTLGTGGLEGVGLESMGATVLLAFPALLLVAFWGRPGSVAAVALATTCFLILMRTGLAANGIAYGVLPAIFVGTLFHRSIQEATTLEKSMQRMAALDALTGVANRQLLYKRASEWRASGGRDATVLSIGLNRFKTINDNLGRAIGDQLLPMVARRLVEASPPGATIARLGGDEFVVFAPGMSGDVEPRRLAKILLARLRETFFVQGRAVHVGARVGVAVGPRHGQDLEILIRHADAAMQRAKERANSIDELSWHGVRHHSQAILLEAELRSAVAGDALNVEFQPIRHTKSGRIVGVEALARWNHAELGPISPTDFIPLAEDGGFISAIDDFVSRTAMSCAAQWARAGWNGWISVNLSAKSISDPRLPRTVRRALKKADMSPERLVLEVTESRAMRDPDATASVLEELKAVGVGVALDDFGMGYSSLAYLKAFPVDHLKIDRTFIDGIGVDSRDEQLLDAILELAHRRGIAVVAEGVENEEQHRWLLERGCEYEQGFLIGRSLSADDFATLVGAKERALEPATTGET